MTNSKFLQCLSISSFYNTQFYLTDFSHCWFSIISEILNHIRFISFICVKWKIHYNCGLFILQDNEQLSLPETDCNVRTWIKETVKEYVKDLQYFTRFQGQTFPGVPFKQVDTWHNERSHLSCLNGIAQSLRKGLIFQRCVS